LKRGSKVLEIVKREAIGTGVRPSGNRRSFGDGPPGRPEACPRGRAPASRALVKPVRSGHAHFPARAGQRGSGGGSSMVPVERRWEGGVAGGRGVLPPPSAACYRPNGRRMPGARPRKRRTEQGSPPKACLGGATPPPRSETVRDGLAVPRRFLRPRRGGSPHRRLEDD